MATAGFFLDLLKFLPTFVNQFSRRRAFSYSTGISLNEFEDRFNIPRVRSTKTGEYVITLRFARGDARIGAGIDTGRDCIEAFYGYCVLDAKQNYSSTRGAACTRSSLNLAISASGSYFWRALIYRSKSIASFITFSSNMEISRHERAARAKEVTGACKE